MRKSMRFLKKYGEKYEVKTKFPTKNLKKYEILPKKYENMAEKAKNCPKSRKV